MKHPPCTWLFLIAVSCMSAVAADAPPTNAPATPAAETTVVVPIAPVETAPAAVTSAPATPAPSVPVVTPAPAPVPAFENHPLAPMDKFAFRVQEDPAKGVHEVLSVTALFELHFPVSRGASEMITLGVRGKTLGQVRQELKSALDTDYYRNATIDLKLVDRSQKGGQVLFTGQVRAYSVPLAPGEQKTIFEGVVQAGATEWANLKKVELQRINPLTQKYELKIVDVEAIRKGDRKNDILLQDGDRVIVPELKFKLGL